MARKKIEPITSLGSEDKLTVQKSMPLFSLWRSNLTLAEFKILDTYLARIDSHNPEKRTVVFEKGELEKLLGVKRVKTEELDERLKHLGTPIRIDDNTAKNKRFTRISLFEKATAEQDGYGLWQVELTASQSAMKYFFNIENLGYLRYKLRCITSITSRYSYIMFTYLEHNRFRKSWEVELDALKHILDCDTVETYTAFKEFNKQLLKRVHKELNAKTECRYTYEPIKKGRSVVAVRFTVESNAIEIQDPDIDQIPGQMSIDDYQAKDLWESALDAAKFTETQIEQIRSTLYSVPISRIPDVGGDGEINRYHYIDRLFKKMLAYNAANPTKPIKNQCAYLCKMIEQDLR